MEKRRARTPGVSFGYIYNVLRNLPIAVQGFILVSVPLVFELVFVGMLAFHLNLAMSQLQQVERAREFRQTTDELVASVYKVARTTSGIHFDNFEGENLPAWGVKVEREFLTPVQQCIDQMQIQETRAFDEEQRNAVREVIRKLTRVVKVVRVLRKSLADDDGMAVMAFNKPVAQEIDRIRKPSGLFDSLNRLIEIERIKEQNYEQTFYTELPQTNRKIISILILGVVANILIAVFAVMFFNRDTAGRFRILMDNTRRLAAGKELQPPIGGSGEIAHLDRVFRDMASALEAARRKERAIIENALDVIAAYDENGRFTAISPACEQLFGYKPQELVGEAYTSIIFDEDLATTGGAIGGIVEGGGKGQFETRVKRKDGTVVDVLWAMQWVPSEKTMYCVAHDITERKQIERMKQEFVAMVSHDLRTPLTSIQGFLTLVSTGMYGELNENGMENLQFAESNIGRLIGLINDLLDIEKMESGKLNMELADTNLNDVLGNSVSSLVGFAQQQLVSLVAVPTTLRANADKDRLIQVVVNLVSNAIKFSPANSTVTVSAEEAGEFVEIKVTDQGRGIPPEFRESIFDRFQQVTASDAKVKGGSGLGLAICKSIVEGHGGTIGVVSEVGKGSTFWFKIPKGSRSSVNQQGNLHAVP